MGDNLHGRLSPIFLMFLNVLQDFVSVSFRGFMKNYYLCKAFIRRKLATGLSGWV